MNTAAPIEHETLRVPLRFREELRTCVERLVHPGCRRAGFWRSFQTAFCVYLAFHRAPIGAASVLNFALCLDGRPVTPEIGKHVPSTADRKVLFDLARRIVAEVK